MTTDHHPLVLVVDDDSDTRELYRMMLESVGYRVADAAQVHSALAVAAGACPDVVLTDWLLPDGDGFEVCRRLRASRLTRHVPVIAVTGVSLDQGAETNALDCFTALLRKPADPDAILAAIGTALTKAAERRLCAAATRTRRYAQRARRRAAVSPQDGEPGIGVDPGALLARVASRSDHSIALVLADDSGHCVAASGATREVTGYEPAELARLTVWDLTPPDAADGPQLWRQFIAAGAQQGRYVLRHRDGQPIATQYCSLANVAPGWHVSAFVERPDLPVTLGADSDR